GIAEQRRAALFFAAGSHGHPPIFQLSASRQNYLTANHARAFSENDSNAADLFALCNHYLVPHLNSAAFDSRDVERGAIYTESLNRYLAGSNALEAEPAVTSDPGTYRRHCGRERVFIYLVRRRRHGRQPGKRHDYRLREAGFGGLIGVLNDGDSADRRAAFRSDFDAGHIGALNLELRPVAVITAAAPRQKRREVGKAQPVLSRRETAEVEIALLVRLGRGARQAEIHALANASGFRIDY